MHKNSHLPEIHHPHAALFTHLHQAGQARWHDTGLPSRRDEYWKYTSLHGLEANPLVIPAVGANPRAGIPAPLLGTEATRLMMNGHFPVQSSHGEPARDGVLPCPLSDAGDGVMGMLDTLCDVGTAFMGGDGIIAMNTASFVDGFCLHVPKDTTAEQAEVLLLSPTMLRNVIVLDNNARATLLMRVNGSDAVNTIANMVTEIHVGDGAHLRLVALYEGGGAEAYTIATTLACLGRDCRVEHLSIGAMDGLLRVENRIALMQEGATVQMDGITVAKGTCHTDMTTFVEHRARHTRSHQLFRQVLDDQAQGVFQGKIVVQRGADGTHGHMGNRALLLSDGAAINARPELEIYADDVECAHGMVAGQLDEMALFYLRSRGVPEEQARRLLTESWLMDVLERVSHEALRENLYTYVRAALHARRKEHP